MPNWTSQLVLATLLKSRSSSLPLLLEKWPIASLYLFFYSLSNLRGCHKGLIIFVMMLSARGEQGRPSTSNIS